MKYNILNTKHILPRLIACCMLLFAIQACKKADQFYNTLQKLPQINNMPEYAYKAAYIIGDTMVINGHLEPKNNMQITIGGIAAKITKIDSTQYIKGDINNTLVWMDQISLLITTEMEGKGREVKITSGGYSIAGAPVDVYTPGGQGSFIDSLKAVGVKSFSDAQHIFLYCVNGKGDIYYYAGSNKSLRHLKKDGSEEVLLDLSKSIDPAANVLVGTFLAGGVDPQGQNLYFSVQTDQGNYRFLQLNLQSKALITLNQSAGLAAPYEGVLSNINMIVTGVYPDNTGNLYLALGLGNEMLKPESLAPFVPDAIAWYNKENDRVSYIYKKVYRFGTTTYNGMPGTNLNLKANLQELRFSPEENLLYALEGDNTTATFELFDLSAHVLLQSFSTSLAGAKSAFDAIAPFSGLKLNLGAAQPDMSFGYLPLPGKRLQTLIYQNTSSFPGNAKNAFPKWIVFDFADQRSYAYATGKFNCENFIFQPSDLMTGSRLVDIMLNYDDAGNLYMTANGKMAIIKTQTVN